MGSAANIYQKLVDNCRQSLDGLVDFHDLSIHQDVIDLFQLLYKQAYHYFRARHAEDTAEELATQAAQAVWENLLNCRKLSGVRQAEAFIGFARKSVIYECWRMQKKYEQEKIVDEAQDAGEDEEEDADWLQMLMDHAAAQGSAFEDPQKIFRQLTDCLVRAIRRLKNHNHRAVIILGYLADLDDRRLAQVLSRPIAEIQLLLAQARAHGLDAGSLGGTFGVSGQEMQAFIHQLRLSGLKDETIAHICGIAIDRVQSLHNQAKKLGVACDDSQAIVAVFKLSSARVDQLRKQLNGHPVKKFEVALALEMVLSEIKTGREALDGGLAEDYEIALILGTTRSNVQAMLSRAKQSLREDREFIECISMQ